MKTIPTLTSAGAAGTDPSPRRAVNPFVNDTPRPNPRDLPVAAGRPTICRQTKSIGCHRERRTRRGRRRLSRRRYRGVLRPGKMLQTAKAFGHYIEYRRAHRRNFRSVILPPASLTSDISP